MKTIAIHICAYNRRPQTRIAYTALERTREEFRSHGYTSYVVVGVSNERDAELAREFGYEPFYVANNPLGNKFNEVAKYIAKRKDFDWFMEYCTDNILDPKYTELAVEAIENGKQYIGTRSFYCVEWKSGEARIFTGGLSNVGRLTHGSRIHRAYQKWGMFYNRRLARHMDSDYNHRIRRFGEPHCIKHDTPLIVDLKDDSNINNYHTFAAHPLKYKVVPLEGTFPELELIQQWQHQAKSDPTPSASGSQTAHPPSQAEPTVTPQAKQPPTSSSHAAQAEPSVAPASSSKRRRKTTTAPAKSSRAASRGQSSAKDSSSTDSPPTSEAQVTSSTSGKAKRKSASRGAQAATATPSTTGTPTSPATKKPQG